MQVKHQQTVLKYVTIMLKAIHIYFLINDDIMYSEVYKIFKFAIYGHLVFM